MLAGPSAPSSVVSLHDASATVRTMPEPPTMPGAPADGWRMMDAMVEAHRRKDEIVEEEMRTEKYAPNLWPACSVSPN